MDNLRGAVVAVAVVAAIALLAGCEKGPVQKAGSAVEDIKR